jgi:hypothetical protein
MLPIVIIFIVIFILYIIKLLWFNFTKDKIDNEDQKINFLLKEFDYLVGSKIEINEEGTFGSKKIKWDTIRIPVFSPKKINKDEWEVLMKIEHPKFPDLLRIQNKDTDYVKIFSISDINLEKIIKGEGKLNGIIKNVKKTNHGRIILSIEFKEKTTPKVEKEVKKPKKKIKINHTEFDLIDDKIVYEGKPFTGIIVGRNKSYYNVVNGLKHGESLSITNDSLGNYSDKITCNFNENKLQGYYTSYYSNGNIKDQYIYEDGIKSETLFENGEKINSTKIEENIQNNDEKNSFMIKYKNLKSYKSKCDSSVYTGNQLKELIISSNIVYDNIKKLSKTLNGGNKGNLINGKIYYDWESIKLFIKELGEKKENVDSRVSFLMTLECIGFCDWEFGQFTSNKMVHLTRYYKDDIDEEELDNIFSTFLIELEIDKQN